MVRQYSDPIDAPGTCGQPPAGRLIHDPCRQIDWNSLTDAQIEAELVQAWSELRGPEAGEDGLSEMVVRLVVTRLQSIAPGDPDALNPAPTYW